MLIEFLSDTRFLDYTEIIKHKPFPIKHHMPDWYKHIQTHIDRNRNQRTVKTCVPFMDALTSGYCIPLPFDLKVFKERDPKKPNTGSLSFEYGMIHTMFNNEVDFDDLGIGGHIQNQYEGMPIPEGCIDQAIKFIFPWHIKTPPGYSCLFTPPMNRERKYNGKINKRN